VSHSDDAHAYGIIPVPIAVLAGRPGPTVLLTAGVHGDEYEGQIVLRRLLREIDPLSLAGRIILMPAVNLPAVRAGRRTSPIDGGNMNRAFPGSADGGPTAQIAYWIEAVLLPRCAAALDLHSGGRTAEYVPCGYVYEGGPRASEKRALARAFGAPLTVLVGSTAENRSLSAAAERAGIPMIATELAGGGTVSASGLAVADAGVRAVLSYLGVVAGAADAEERRTRFIRIPDRRHFVICPRPGIIEPVAALGDTVAAGDLAALVHDLDDPAAAPVGVHFGAAGIVIVRRLPAPALAGDYLFTTGQPASDE
jgi:predicted deacylase